jgi:hypothetical protein
MQEHSSGIALPSLQERFKGMVTLYASNLPSTVALATASGCIPATHLQQLLQPQQPQQQQQQQEDEEQDPGVAPQQEQQQHGQSNATSGGEDVALLEMFAPPASHKGLARAGQVAATSASDSSGVLLPDAAEAARTMLQELGEWGSWHGTSSLHMLSCGTDGV